MTGKYDGTGANSPQWWPSRHGADDELGGGNELTPERTMEALRIPKEGRAIELAQTLEVGVPAYPPRGFQQIVLAHQTLHALAPEGGDMVGFEEQVTQTYHVGCHLDGLGHVGIAGRFYNGVHHEEFYDARGLRKFGMESVRPWINRGVCLDIAGLEGADVLPGGYAITPEHLEAACEKQGVEVRVGDSVLLHTGWASKWMQGPEYETSEPGATADACRWLNDRHVSMVGADNWAFEVLPVEDPLQQFVGHQILLAEGGTYILENIKTQELADGGHSEFLFLMAPIKVKGATGSQVSPVVVV